MLAGRCNMCEAASIDMLIVWRSDTRRGWSILRRARSTRIPRSEANSLAEVPQGRFVVLRVPRGSSPPGRSTGSTGRPAARRGGGFPRSYLSGSLPVAQVGSRFLDDNHQMANLNILYIHVVVCGSCSRNQAPLPFVSGPARGNCRQFADILAIPPHHSQYVGKMSKKTTGLMRLSIP